MALWSRKEKVPGGPATMTLEEVIDEDKYEIIKVSDEPGRQFIVLAPANKKLTEPAPLGEIGSSAPSPFTSFTRREYNAELAGIRGLEKYDKMRKGDGAVRGSLRIIKTPVLAARWFMEPGGEKKVDKTASDFIWKCLTEYMSISWSQVMTESLLMLDFGYYMFEKVYEPRIIDGKLRMVWKKLAPRHPMDVKEWYFDENGGPEKVCMFPSTIGYGAGYGLGTPSAPTQGFFGYNPNSRVVDIADDPEIPIDKLLVFTFDKEAGNIEGTSVLRSAYKHWYYKEQLYKIDAIQKERHGIGIPIIKLPMGYSESDKRAAEDLGRNLRTNERAHVVLPPMWDVAMLKMEGQPVDCLKSIDHHNDMIYQNVLAQFLQAKTTGTSDTDQMMFLKATRFIADTVVDTFNMHAIPQLTAMNFNNAAPPKLRVRRIGEQADWRTLSFAVRNLIGAGVIRPDDELERVLRDEMDLPKGDPDTMRIMPTPQGGPQGDKSGTPNPNVPGAPGQPGVPRVGPPRQAPVGGMRNQVGVPAPNAGRDASGGK